jgi:hypothetical protein
MPTSQYQTAAAAKWPKYRIHGDGPHALVCPISYSVILYGFWMEAACAVMEQHYGQCRAEHRLEEIKPAPRRTPVPRNFADKIERD